jgi:hypothetical protein
LANFLGSHGITVRLDHWHNDGRKDWFAWALSEIPAADFVLVIASPRYRAFGDGSPPSGENRGVQAETAVLRDLLYEDRRTWLARVLPVVLPSRSLDELPKFTQPYSASHFVIDAITDEGTDALLRVLTRQPRYVPPARGKVPALPRTTDAVGGLVRKARALQVDGWAAVTAGTTTSAMIVVLFLFGLSWLAALFTAVTGALVLTMIRRGARELGPQWKIVALTVTPLLAGILVALPHGRDHVPEVTSHDSPLAPTVDSPTVGESSAANSPRTADPTATAKPSQARGSSTSAPGGPDYSGSGSADEQGHVPAGRSGSRGGTIEILAVGHTFAPGIDRITATIRNSRPDPVLVTQIRIYMHRPHGSWHSHDTWHFTVPGDMRPGGPGEDGSRRTQGLIAMSGSEFSAPLIGQGYLEEQDSFKRLLTFEPQNFLAGSATATIVIDIPNTMLLQATSREQPAGPMVEYEFKPQQGSIFTYFELQTSEDLAYACDYIRQREDEANCGKVDPLAAVALPH